MGVVEDNLQVFCARNLPHWRERVKSWSASSPTTDFNREYKVWGRMMKRTCTSSIEIMMGQISCVANRSSISSGCPWHPGMKERRRPPSSHLSGSPLRTIRRVEIDSLRRIRKNSVELLHHRRTCRFCPKILKQLFSLISY